MLFCSTKHCCSCCCSTAASCHRHDYNIPFSASLNIALAPINFRCRNAILGVVQLLNVCWYYCFSTTMPWWSWQQYRTELGSPSSTPLLLVRMTRKRKLEKCSQSSKYGRYFTFKIIFVLSFSVTKFAKQSQNTTILLSYNNCNYINTSQPEKCSKLSQVCKYRRCKVLQNKFIW